MIINNEKLTDYAFESNQLCLLNESKNGEDVGAIVIETQRLTLSIPIILKRRERSTGEQFSKLTTLVTRSRATRD